MVGLISNVTEFLYYYYNGSSVIIGIAYLALAIVTLFVLLRINRMRIAANINDIEGLKALDSNVWAIIALIFSGVIPGIILLIVSPEIKQISATSKSGIPLPDIDKLSKLKEMLDSEVLTKEEFESQKKLILHPSSEQPSDTLEITLNKLKSLYQSGALTEDEYNQEKRKLLSGS